ncbi:MAG: hypothetical protein R3338_07890, partial [Thermoanaerobaculia bacterium]|nr:hypothetical protein [Thermoanaerobaculia bacterium]
MDSPVIAWPTARVVKILLTVAAATLLVVTPVAGQTTQPFYENQLAIGELEFEAGNYSEAARHLEIASFGLMEDLALYQKAQIFATLAEQGRGNFREARAAVRRALKVETLSPTYPPENIEPSVLAAFEAAVNRIMPEVEFPPERPPEAVPVQAEPEPVDIEPEPAAGGEEDETPARLPEALDPPSVA